MKLVIGRMYVVKCGWGDTVSVLTAIRQDKKDNHNIYEFKAVNDGFKYISHDTDDITERTI